MKKIAVTFNNELFAWVDTVIKYHDFVFAVLVSPKTGAVIARSVSDIRVVDNDILE